MSAILPGVISDSGSSKNRTFPSFQQLHHQASSGYQRAGHTRVAMLAPHGKGRAPAGGKPLLRHLSVIALLLAGFSFGHAIKDARGLEDGRAKSDMAGRRQDLDDLPTVDPPGSSSSRGVVAPEGGNIGTQGDAYGNSNSNSQDLSLCLLLIVRDEESNLKVNLPLWRDVVHCYVIGVDDRTTDGTVQAIHDALDEDTPR